MAQTTKTANIYYPNGAKVSVQKAQAGAFFDVGAISGTVSATLQWDENQFETANAGKLAKQIKNMTIDGAFTLVNLDPEGVEIMGAGVFERVETAGTATTTVDDQEIAAGWVNASSIDLEIVDGGDDLVASIDPTFTSITGATAGVLAAGDDYLLQANSNSPSGYSIILNTSGTAGLVTTEIVTIDYNSVTPVASVQIHCGTSTQVLTAYAMMIEDVDTGRSLTIYSVDSNAGGFAFGFKGAEEDGVDEMPLTFTGQVDTSRTDGRQLMTWSVPV